jgi:hypothetical protein
VAVVGATFARGDVLTGFRPARAVLRSPVMVTPDQYRSKARDCERLARDGDPHLRAMYASMAAQWRLFAEQLDRVEVQTQKRFVVENGCPELVEAMNKGDLDIATAIDLARLPRDHQSKCLIDEKLRHFFTRIMHGDGDEAASR